MIRAIAVDDEPMPLNILKEYSKETSLLYLERTFTSTASAHAWLEENSVDLLFMDISMPAISGIEFIQLLKKNYLIIFTTAHADYAIEGFELNAIDYLLKPFTLDRFLRAISKAHEFHTLKKLNSGNEITIKSSYANIRVSAHEILFIEAYSDYLKIHQEGKQTIVTRMTMKNILDILPEGFLRVHRSFIVQVGKIDQRTSSSLKIKDREIPIGKTYKPALSELLR